MAESGKAVAVLKENIRSLLLIILGIFSASFGLKGFLLPNHFIDGGVTGISLLVSITTKIPLSILIFLINVPFIILAYFQISKTFALKTFLAIVGLAVVLALVEFPTITEDKLLIAIFGGIFLGAGVGLSVRGGSVLDGTEIMALYVGRKTENSIGDMVLIFNVIIFLSGAFILGVEPALYSILTYMAASRTIDYLVEGVEEYTGVTIISERNARIKRALVTKLGRGVTVYKGKRTLIGKHAELDGVSEMEILFTIVTKLEIGKVKKLINDIDEHAFIYYFPISNAKGGVLKRRPLHP
ncbi:MAG: YitT family protein [Bacteroidales bacterium]|nr:YitT family protein [Bacteroidales bacterium]